MTYYSVTTNAYAKVAFHAAKYPHRTVNGVLIGKGEPGSVTLTDAVPLLHHWTNLSPSMEIGLDLVSNTRSAPFLVEVDILTIRDMRGKKLC